MITIKKKTTTISYPYDELVDIIKNSAKPGSIPLLMIGIKTKFALAPKTTIEDSIIHIQERSCNAIYSPDRNGNTKVEYRFEIHWFTLIIWIISIFFIVGILYIPLIVIIRNLGISHRVKSINKHAYNALMELNPIDNKNKTVSTRVETKNESPQMITKTPPPIKKNNPKIEYFVHLNDEQMGPYDFEKIKLLIEFKNINGTTLVWKEGMEDWGLLSSIEELAIELKK
jgi:hypothetical protein